MALRRLPVYLLIDTSGSMRGEPIEAVKVGLQALVSGLRQDPYALESVHLSLIAFDQQAKVLCPLTSLEEFQMPLLQCPEAGPTHLGEALRALCECVEREVARATPERKGDWRPLLFIMTDGSPSDLAVYDEWAERTRAKGFAAIVACAAGSKAKQEPLRKVADHVVTLDTMDSAAFSGFFKWVSSTVSAGSVSMGLNAPVPLPPPPQEVHVVL
jgi:uncharacterized protein YegL